MRSILTVSLPLQKKEEIQKRAKKAKKTISAYILDALNLVQDFISEDELVSMAKQSEKNYNAGKTDELKSLSDLMK